MTTCALPNRVTAVSQKRPGRLSLRELLPTALAGIVRSTRPMRPVGSTQSWLRLAGEQPAQHLVGGPRDGRDGRDAEALVDERAARVVDAGDDVLDAVGLAGDAGAQDVGVVAVRHRGESPGLVDAGLREVVAVEAEADDRRARRSPAPRRRKARAFLSTTATV